MSTRRNLLDYYKGRFSYTEIMNMSLRHYQTLYYMMWKDYLAREQERIEKESEEAARGDQLIKQPSAPPQKYNKNDKSSSFTNTDLGRALEEMAEEEGLL